MAIILLNITSGTMDKAIADAAGKLEVMTAPKGMSFKVELEVDSKIEKEVAKDALINQEMKDAVRLVYDDLVQRIGTNLKTTDKGAISLRDANNTDKLKKLVEVVNKGIEGARDVAVERAQKDAMKCWAELVKQRKEYTKYKAKIGVKITLGVVGLGVSIGLLAGGVVSFGASSIPGIVGMVKSVAVIASQIKSAAEEIETSQKRLDGQLKSIEDKFVNARGQFTKAGKAQEIGVTLAAQLFGTTGPFAIVPNIKECVGALDVIKSKFGGIKVNAHDAAKDLNKMIDAVEQAKKKFLIDVDKKLAKMPSAKADRKKIEEQLNAALLPFEKKVESSHAAVLELLSRYKTAEPKIKLATTRVEQLVKLKGVGWKIFENALVFTDLATSFADPGQYAKLTETLGGLIPAAGGLAADKITKIAFEGTILE